MAIEVIFDGEAYQVPERGDTDWNDDLTRLLQDLAQKAVAAGSGAFNLSAELDFGSQYGIKALTIKSRSNNVANAGIIRLANTDTIGFRNFANSGNLLLGPSTANVLQFNGVDLVNTTLTQTLTNKTLTSPAITSPTITGSGTSVLASLTSSTANPSAAGFIRLAKTDAVGWRNNANSANLPLDLSVTDRLQFNTVAIPTISSTDTLTNKTISGASNTLSSINKTSLTQVYARSTIASGVSQTVTDGATVQVAFGTTVLDSHSAITNPTSTWTWTCPSGQSGIYLICSHVCFQMAASGDCRSFIRVNAADYACNIMAAQSGYCTTVVSAVASLSVGDTIKVFAFQSSGGSRIILGDVNFTHISITKL